MQDVTNLLNDGQKRVDLILLVFWELDCNLKSVEEESKETSVSIGGDVIEVRDWGK